MLAYKGPWRAKEERRVTWVTGKHWLLQTAQGSELDLVLQAWVLVVHDPGSSTVASLSTYLSWPVPQVP